MDIRMYNCGFGDCFRLQQDFNQSSGIKGKCLYVDFGIHKLSKGIDRFVQYNNIISEMPDSCDFLLTHYHEDHYAGVIYMFTKTAKRFDDIYIPDIWSVKENIPVIALHLIKEMLNHVNLAGSITLFDFLKSACSALGTIHFISRKSPIQEQYVALWPAPDAINKKARTIINSLPYDKKFITEVLELAGRLRDQMLWIQAESISEHRNNFNLDNAIKNLNRLQDESVYLAKKHSITSNPSVRRKIKDYENEISIVFQNTVPFEGNNILFTGDFPRTKYLWRMIECNTDGLVQMHQSFHIIKIPHHGTKTYYHSFAYRSSHGTCILIPNGQNANNWKVFDQYSEDANHEGWIVFCSENYECSAVKHGKCNCIYCNTISPNIGRDI